MHTHNLTLALAAELLDEDEDTNLLDLDHICAHAPHQLEHDVRFTADQFRSLPDLLDMSCEVDIGTQIDARFALAMTVRRLAHGDTFTHAIHAVSGPAPAFLDDARALVGFLGTTVLAPCDGTGTDAMDGIQFQAIVTPDGVCMDLVGPYPQQHAPARVFRLGETRMRLAPLRVVDGDEEKVAVVYAGKDVDEYLAQFTRVPEGKD
ncbi:hypothetical protein GGF32_001079 [Allomyces javanicus]|nr:hypothetical protein GGF32_001079 [Allomyces javanicus]